MVADSERPGKVGDAPPTSPTDPVFDPTSMPMRRPRSLTNSATSRSAAVVLGALIGASSGCGTNMREIDERTERTLLDAANDVSGDTIAPRTRSSALYEGDPLAPDYPERYRPPTTNPAADDLRYESLEPTAETLDAVAERIEAAGRPPRDAVQLDLRGAIRYAIDNSVEYLNAEETYIIVALSLIIEQHRWEPRPFNLTEVGFDAVGNDGRFQRTLRVANELGVTQRLPYGGEVAATMVVDMTTRMDNFLGENNTSQGAELLLEAAIPFLRGSGIAAREELIQRSRDLIYAARTFEEFRRRFCFDLVGDYLDLVLAQQEIANAKRQVESSRQVDRREDALVRAGRQPPFQADLAKQNTLFAINRLARLEELYRVAVDNFKVRLGMDPTTPVVIEPVKLDLPLPSVAPGDAVRTAMNLRLDLQTIGDRVEDARRRVDVASNKILPSLDLVLEGVIPTDNQIGRFSGLNVQPSDGRYRAAAVFGAPLDRVIERAELRQEQIRYEQSIRNERLARDDAAVEVRTSLRAIELSRFSLLLQEQNVAIAINREASIAAAPDRASARDRTEALDQRREAEDQRDRAQIDLQVAILAYLLSSGQFRVSPDGLLMPIPGLRGTEVIGTLPEDVEASAPPLDGAVPEPGVVLPPADPTGADGNFPVEVQPIAPPTEPPPAVDPTSVPPASGQDPGE